MENTNIQEKIGALKERLIAIQDRFIAALIADDGEGAEEDRASVAEALSWAISMESTLSAMRVNLLLLDTNAGRLSLPSAQDALDMVSTIQRQVEETESSLNHIEEV